MNEVMTAILVGLGLTILPCLYRIARGPHSMDRLLAFDLSGTIIALAVAVFAFLQQSAAYLDISIGLAVLAYIGTLGFAQYVARRRVL